MPDISAQNDADIVVIGAGQAGFAFCAKLRALGVKSAITLIGEEDQPPYQRPPLSKAYLLGKMDRERLFFRPESFYNDENIAFRRSCRVQKINPSGRSVHLEDGSTLPYSKLLLTTGARPIRLPDEIGGALKGVFYMRDLADADALSQAVSPGKRVLVVGGGYIGLEAAAVAAGLGMQVVLVEAADRILQRVASAETSDYFRQLHQDHGVEIREGVMLDQLTGIDGKVSGAVLSDGSKADVDIVLAGIGIRPNQELAEAAGLTIENGIAVDAFCRTSDPGIFAAGDCVSFPHGSSRIRLESVGNAIDQAEAAAASIAGNPLPYLAKPWFWSDQYDTKLQIVGLSTGYDTIVSRKANGAGRSFWYFKQNDLLAVDAINDPRAYMVAKRLIEAGKSPNPARVADIRSDLKSLL